MNVILAQPKDVARIIELRTEAFLDRAPKFYNTKHVQNLLHDYNEAEILEMIDDRRFLVDEENGEILGTSGWEKENVRHIYVRPDCMHRGIGKTMLIAAETDYRNRTEKPYIFAGVILYAKGFYEKNGYHVLSKEKAWDDSDYYFMRKDFHSAYSK